VEFAAAGIFLAGAARFCADVRETVAQAGAAATKAGTLMSARKVKVDAITAWVDEPSCSGCARCESACNFGAIRLETTYEGRRVAKVNHVLCKGCGGCVALCPNRAIQQHGFSDQQLLCMIEAMLSGEYLETPRLLVFACNWCAYAGADLAGILRLNTPQDFRIIRVMCSCRVGAELVVAALCKGVDGVLILGCHPGECHYGRGNYFARRRGLILKRLLQRFGFEPERFNLGWVSASEGHRFSQMVKESIHRLRKIGLSRIKRDAGYTTLGS
jgi:heterodisulfide reductase subunit A